jgi:hypothetical protein
MMNFNLTSTQEEKLKKWKESIKTIYGEYGSYTYSFRPTGIGDVVTVQSDLVGPNHVLDLTEVENW